MSLLIHTFLVIMREINIIKQINTTSWKIKIFLPYGHFVQYKIKKLFSKNKNIQLVFINIKEFNGFNFIKHFFVQS